jgi:putative flippase GtrA
MKNLHGIARSTLGLPLTRFMTIGVVSTLAYAVLYWLLQGPLGAVPANALALALTAVANTAANRRFTFGVRGREDLMRQHAAGAAVFLLALGITNGALAGLHALDTRPSAELQLWVLIVASATATVARYAVLRAWVFAHAGHPKLPRRKRGLRPISH